jgi:hypothetical protein
LFRVEPGADVFEFAERLRNDVLPAAKPAKCEICFARAAPSALAGNWKLGDDGMLVGRDPACFSVSPSIDEEGLGEGAFGLGLIENQCEACSIAERLTLPNTRDSRDRSQRAGRLG